MARDRLLHDRGLLGNRTSVAVAFALTRKHHRKDLCRARAVMRLIEKVEEAEEETQVDFIDPLWDARAVKGLFRLSHGWVKKKDRFEVVVCDEAHRFRRSTTLKHLQSGRPQAEEILENARIMVAFVDEKQRLRKAEEGTVDYFKRCAARVGLPLENVHGPIELTAQFRAAGNGDFVKVLDKALYEEMPAGFSHRDFAFQVEGSVEGLEAYLQEQIDKGHSARLLAGFCWERSDPNRDGTLVDDVRVGHR